MNLSNLPSQVCLFILAITFVTSAKGQTSSFTPTEPAKSVDESRQDKIDELVSFYTEYGKFNGSVLIAEKGEVLFKKGYGSANFELDVPNQPDTKFRLASVTKQFTAMMVMQLVAEGKLALDEPVSSYLPDYPKETGDQINIHHLLTHSSGIPNYTSFPGYRDMMKKSMTPTELVSTFADSTLLFAPGERFSYSNSGYVLLGAIIEKVTGKTCAEVLEEKILSPLQMNNTGFADSRSILKNRATGYDNNLGDYSHSSYIDLSVAYTAGGMFSTVEDLYRWDRALYTSKLLPKKYLDLIFEKHIPAWGQHYGYGWQVGEFPIGNTNEKLSALNHDGVINGFSSLVFRIPKDHSSIILLNNTGGAPLHEMARAISAILYDKTYDLPKRSVALELLKVINDDGMTVAEEFYEQVSNDRENYVLDENEINLASYQLLENNQTRKAARVLELALSTFPYAFNLHDSYGEMLLELGQKDEAIESYRRSVHLNPKNENGLMKLKELGVEIDPASLYLLKTDKSWSKEIFIFPLHFAQDLHYLGIEESHFPEGWRDQESPEFWSYAYVWNIDLNRELTTAELESHIESYYNGLMNVVNKNKELTLPKSVAKIERQEDGDSSGKFKGTVDVYDAFVTQENLTLNVLVETFSCAQRKESFLFFRISPQEFGGQMWSELNQISLRPNFCED